jgi:small-conductance mechanosensitive channel
MKGLRSIVVLLVAAAALSLAVTLALAAPTALSPTRSAAAAQYCPPGLLSAREKAADRAEARLSKAEARLAKFRAQQLKIRAKAKSAKTLAGVTKAQEKAYAMKVRNLRAFQKQLAAAQAKLARCS